MSRKKDQLRLVKDRREKPLWKKLISFLFRSVIFVLLILLIIYGHSFFQLAEIVVKGADLYSEEEILSAAGIEMGMSIFLLQEQKIATKITDRFPEIKAVEVTRTLPAGITLNLVKRVAAAYVITPDGYWLIDQDTVCFAYAEEPFAKYPLISGLDSSLLIPGEPLACAERRAALLSFFAQWPGDTELKAAEINLADNYNLAVTTIDGLHLWLGDGSNLDYKLHLVAESLPYITTGPDTRLDLRSGKRLIVSETALSKEEEVNP